MSLLEITTKQISENEALKLYDDLIRPEISALKKSKNKRKDRTNNILNLSSKLESAFTGVYVHYDDKPTSGESIAERTIQRRQRSDEIAKKEKTISPELFKRFFGYSGPSDMYKILNKARTTEKNKAQVNEIENKLPDLIEIINNKPTNDTKKLETKIIYWKLYSLLFYFYS